MKTTIQIKIDLPDGDYCNGCACLRYEDDFCKHYQLYPETKGRIKP